MQAQDYNIADLRLRVEGEKLSRAVESLAGFNIYQTHFEKLPDLTFKEGNLNLDNVKFINDLKNLPEFEKIIYSDSNEIANGIFGLKKGGGYIFCSTSNCDSGKLAVEISEDGRESFFSGDLSPHLLKFSCWMAYSVASIRHKTVALHASTIVYDNKAVLFLGESGTGKSTHTRLWLENIEGANLLNDDSPLVKITGEDVKAFGSPWSGKSNCYVKEDYEIAAFVRLSQAPYNKIRRLGALESFVALHPSCPPPFAYVESLYDYIADFLNKVITDVPVYQMECLPTPGAALLSCDTIFGKCEKR